MYLIYCKILMSPELIFAQEGFLLGLFSGELIFRGAHYWREFIGEFDNKNSRAFNVMTNDMR